MINLYLQVIGAVVRKLREPPPYDVSALNYADIRHVHDDGLRINPQMRKIMGEGRMGR